eukprot:2678037-Rhodomonas_salina.2
MRYAVTSRRVEERGRVERVGGGERERSYLPPFIATTYAAMRFLCAGRATCGTELAYAATRRLVWRAIAAYALSGTELACSAVSSYALAGTELTYAATILLCDVRYQFGVCCHARAMRCL